jgi:lipopolysaccharide/colanic/teichoic acid biosynthesis glycosyltransferase
LLIKFTSAGPVLFRQKRVGRGGKPFQVFKLRTMRNSPAQGAPKVTYAGDRRITRVGHFMRAHKLDELPQLVNVLRGEMSLVGPRPLVPEQTVQVFPCRPGLTGVGSLAFRNQEQALHLVHPEDLVRVHAEVLTKRRIEAECKYLLHSSLWSDIDVICQSALAVAGIRKRTSYDVDVRGLIVSWASRAGRARAFQHAQAPPLAREGGLKAKARAAGV